MSTAPDPQSPPTVSVTTSDPAVLLAIARLESKLDVALASHGTTLEGHDVAIKDH